MYLATCDTQHFTFMALGESREQAKEALVAAFDAHYKQYRKRFGITLRKSWWKDGEYEIVILPMMPGQGYRDHEPIGEHVPDRL